MTSRHAPQVPHELPMAEAKARLSEVVRTVQNGHPVTITSHGRPVADLVPHDPNATAVARPARQMPGRISVKPGPAVERLVADLRGVR